jgi:hypothetical protein
MYIHMHAELSILLAFPLSRVYMPADERYVRYSFSGAYVQRSAQASKDECSLHQYVLTGHSFLP